MILLIFGLCAIASTFIILSAVRISVSEYRTDPNIWRNPKFWLSCGFSLVSLGLLEFCLMRVWQSLFTAHVPFVQSPVWALAASVTILLGLVANMRVLAINKPPTGARFLIAAAAWVAFCVARELLIKWYGLY